MEADLLLRPPALGVEGGEVKVRGRGGFEAGGEGTLGGMRRGVLRPETNVQLDKILTALSS